MKLLNQNRLQQQQKMSNVPGFHSTMAYKQKKVKQRENQKQPVEYLSVVQPQQYLKGLLPQTKKMKKIQINDETSPINDGKELTMKTMTKIGKQGFHKQKNLKLRDYLRLTSLSKKEARKSRSKTHGLQHPPELKKQETKYIGSIDTAQSIAMIRESTQKQFKETSSDLKVLIAEIEKCDEIGKDQESLVFMCNVFNVFEERITVGLKYAKDLMEDQKMKRKKKQLKEYGKDLKKIDLQKKTKYKKQTSPDTTKEKFQSRSARYLFK